MTVRTPIRRPVASTLAASVIGGAAAGSVYGRRVAATPPAAATFYIAQTATGAADGSSPANAKAVSYLNDSNNWGAGKPFAPGAIIGLCGTITSTITVQGSGTSGSPITLYFMPGAKMSAPAFVDWAIRIDRKDWITVDGGVDGIIENTANGSNRAHQIASAGIAGDSCNHLLVHHLTVRNIYVHDDRADITNQDFFGLCISNSSGAAGAFTDFEVHDCHLSHAGIGVNADYGVVSAVNWHHNTIRNCNWGGRIGDRGVGAITSNIQIHHNDVADYANWDTDIDLYHHNGFYCWAESGGHLRDVRQYANLLGPGYGNCFDRPGGCATSGLFFSGNIGDILVYNNLFLADEGGDAPASGFIVLWSTQPFGSGNTGLRALNNTIVGTGGGKGITFIGRGGYEAKNNVIVAVTTAIYFSLTGGLGVLDSDYNLAYGLTAGQEFSQSTTGAGNFYSFAGWQGLGHDTHGQVSNPALTGSYHLGGGSPGLNAATNLFSSFTTDKDDVVRPSTGPWHVGAYQP